MLSKSINDDIDRLLLQWFRAKHELSNGGGGGSHPMWNQAARGPRAGNIVPLMQGELERTDKALKAMEAAVPYLHELLLESKLDMRLDSKRCLDRTQDAKAKARNMSIVTYWRWRDRAISTFWRAYQGARIEPLRQAVAPRSIDIDVKAKFTQKRKRKAKKRNQSSPQARASAGA